MLVVGVFKMLHFVEHCIFKTFGLVYIAIFQALSKN